jgi:helix-turn-helix protein
LVPTVTSKRNTITKAGKRVVTFAGDGKPQLDPLLTVHDAAAILKVSASSLNKWRVLGVGPPHVRVGTRVRYRPSDLATYITESTKESTSALRRPI